MGDPLGEALAAIFGLIFFVAILCVGGLFLSSKAVLFWEAKTPDYDYYSCSYFTGTRIINSGVFSSTGCKRFISVGEQ